MSPKMKRLSGKAVISILGKFGFIIHSQKDAHVKLRRIHSTGKKQTLTAPLHDEIDAGTLLAVIRQAGRYIPEEQLKAHFYDKG